ncbi:hypothetical protein GCM10027280_29840 [Micromonospora polyrhachis]|uniref:Uncharacterized protein n=1 Tax=Micromonospora polyrhachis TaxID=1282883 RepID=A0A7W7SQE3_9ACTN|nr:hypothetical protein [Micromonospora polyrhachis]MBB4959034.1 hypothetical protein [Micromonospora polyrhachis]
MAHVELSLSEAPLPPANLPPASMQAEADPDDSFTRWSATVSQAAEPCLLIDFQMIIAAVSDSCCQLLGLGRPVDVVDRPLLGGELRLLDFTAARAELTEQEIDKIPPLLALASGRLARGLLRVRPNTPAGGADATVDAISTPILEQGLVAGSLTFFAKI